MVKSKKKKIFELVVIVLFIINVIFVFIPLSLILICSLFIEGLVGNWLPYRSIIDIDTINFFLNNPLAMFITIESLVSIGLLIYIVVNDILKKKKYQINYK